MSSWKQIICKRLSETATTKAANARLLADCLSEFEDDPSCCHEHIQHAHESDNAFDLALDAVTRYEREQRTGAPSRV